MSLWQLGDRELRSSAENGGGVGKVRRGGQRLQLGKVVGFLGGIGDRPGPGMAHQPGPGGFGQQEQVLEWGFCRRGAERVCKGGTGVMVVDMHVDVE